MKLEQAAIHLEDAVESVPVSRLPSNAFIIHNSIFTRGLSMKCRHMLIFLSIKLPLFLSKVYIHAHN